MALLPMDVDILPAYDDRVFKKIMLGKEAAPARVSIVSAVIGRRVTDVIVRNSELPADDTEEKAQRFDLNCVIDDGSQLNIEMQSSRIAEKPGGGHLNLIGKSVYYLCDLHSSQSSKGKSYDELAKTYQVTFCGYTVFPNRANFINGISLRHDDDNELLCDIIRVVFVELSKLHEILKKPISEMTGLEKWSIFLRYAESLDYRNIVNDVIKSEEALNVASELLMSISQDERERAIFMSRRKFQSDQESNLIKSRRTGRQEAQFEIARNLLQKDMPSAEIADVTGLTREEVEGLRN